MDDFGGMVKLEVHGSLEDAGSFVDDTKVSTLAESPGGVESLLEHPATRAHVAVPEDERFETGVSDTLVRLGVGFEDVEDLRAGFARELEAAGPGGSV